MNLIVNVDKDWGIGKQEDLLEKIPEDLKFFKEMTLGKTIIMGRVTFESLPNGKPLKNRNHIVLTNNKNFEYEGVVVCHSIREVFDIITNLKAEDVFVVGGGQIYKEFLPYCQKAYITKVLKTHDADTFFPNIEESDEWALTCEGQINYYNDIPYQFNLYERISQGKCISVFSM